MWIIDPPNVPAVTEAFFNLRDFWHAFLVFVATFVSNKIANNGNHQ